MTRKILFGIGINDADYNVYKTAMINGKHTIIWCCTYYRRWSDMIRRCYNPKTIKIRPNYKDCFVCDEWLYFSNFKLWMEQQDWEGKDLDKDLLYPGNKIYSPETCVFVDRKINAFVTDRSNSRTEGLIGASFEKETGRFKASCQDEGRTINLGRYSTSEEAHKAWLAFKLEKAYKLAAEQTDPRVAEALIDRYENYAIHN